MSDPSSDPIYTINNNSPYTYYCCVYTQNNWIQLPAKTRVLLYGQAKENKIHIHREATFVKKVAYILPSYSCTIEISDNRIYATGDVRDVPSTNIKMTGESSLLTIHNHTSKNVPIVHCGEEKTIAPGAKLSLDHNLKGKGKEVSISSITISPSLSSSRTTFHVRNEQSIVTYEKDLLVEQTTTNSSIFAFITLIGIIVVLLFLYNNYAPR